MATAYETQTLRATFHDFDARPGKCAVCGQPIDQRRLWDACRYATEDGTVVMVHQTCGSVDSKSKIGGGRKLVSAKAITVKVRVPVLHDA